MEVAFVSRQAISRTTVQDDLKHLIGFRPNYKQWSIAEMHGRTWLHRPRSELEERRQRCFGSGGDGLHQLD